MIAILLTTIGISFAADLDNIAFYEGQSVELCGTVVSIRVPETENHPNVLSVENKLNVVIWENDVKNIEISPPSLVGNKVCVSGTITKYKEDHQITVRSHNQIRIKNNDSR